MKSFCDRALGRLAFRAPQRDARLFCDGQKFLAEGCIHDEAKVLDMKKFIRVFGTWCTGRQYCVALWNSHYAPLMFHLAQAFPLLPTQMLTIRVSFFFFACCFLYPHHWFQCWMNPAVCYHLIFFRIGC